MSHRTIDVLLVEDNPDDEELILLSLAETLKMAQIQVVRDGVAALDFLFGMGTYETRDIHDRPQVIFLDLKLPKLSGLQVLETIKRDDRTRNIPVVILTSSQEDQDIHQSYYLGANSYVVKPVHYKEFKQAVKDLGSYWQNINVPDNR